MYISGTNSHVISDKGIEGRPDLIIEIISPSNSYIDRYIKKKKYEEFGVKEYWIADPGNKTLEIFSLNEQKQYELFLFLAEEGHVRSGVLEEMGFDLKGIFAQ